MTKLVKMGRVEVVPAPELLGLGHDHAIQARDIFRLVAAVCDGRAGRRDDPVAFGVALDLWPLLEHQSRRVVHLIGGKYRVGSRQHDLLFFFSLAVFEL
jgi:hypothetical protein